MTDNQMLIGQHDSSGLFLLLSLLTLVGIGYIVYPPFTFLVDSFVERFKNWIR
jgi:hypothetical protein